MNNIYFQPLLTEKEWIETNLPSFGVYKHLSNAKEDFPNHYIIAYSGNDIENPTYLDKEENSNQSKDKLTITKNRFLEWYFEHGQDTEKNDLRISLANSIIHQMNVTGFGSYSVQELFDKCNQEAIRLYFTEEYAHNSDEFDIELSDCDFDYELELID